MEGYAEALIQGEQIHTSGANVTRTFEQSVFNEIHTIYTFDV